MAIKRILILIAVTVLKLASFLELKQNNYVQVPSTFLSSFPTCSNLQSVVLQNQPIKIKSFGCLLLCSSTANCNLACYKGSSCLLSSALVTSYWVPIASVVQSILPYPGYKCFSSWVFENDLTSHIANVISSPQTSNQFQVGYAVDGYYCDTWDTHFETVEITNGWIEIDMGKQYRISSVIVKTRTAYDGGAFFSNVIVRVGNASGNGVYSGYTTFGSFPGRAADGQVITFNELNPISGRYISLMDGNYEYFVMGEVKIIGFNV